MEANNFDDKPIGSSNQLVLDEYPPDFNPQEIQNASKNEQMPLVKRIQSKVWKSRKEAFDQLLTNVEQDPTIFEDFQFDTLKFITDNNAQCQEKALKILLTCLNNDFIPKVEAKALIKVLIEKCLVSEKEAVVSTTNQVLFWEMDHGHEELILNELNENLLAKNPKICANSMKFIALLLKNYGKKRLKNMEKFAKHLGFLANATRPVAKKECIEMYKEFFKWMGKKIFEEFVMQGDIKDEVIKFTKTYTPEPLEILRGLPKEQLGGKKVVKVLQEEEEDSGPIDVLSAYDSKWVDKVLEVQKWKEKKIILDEFIKKTRVRTIMPTKEYSHFITLLKRLLMDNNINLLQCGFKILKNLSRGLKKHFQRECKVLLEYVFVKLRDKKGAIVDEAHETLKSMCMCLSMESFMDYIKEGLSDKSPSMRVEVLKFLENFTGKKDTKVSQVFVTLLDMLAALNQDGNGDVRDKALDILCKLKDAHSMKFFGDKLKNLPENKLKKIKEYVGDNQMIDNESSSFQNQVGQVQEEKCTKLDVEEQNKVEVDLRPAITSAHSKSHRMPSKDKPSYIPVKKNLQTSLDVEVHPRENKSLGGFNVKDLASNDEIKRIAAYEGLVCRSVSKETVEILKENFLKESSAHILKHIISIFKKICINSPLEYEHIDYLLMHDWKKCKKLLTDFLSNSKMNLEATELLRSNGLLYAKKDTNVYRAFFIEFQDLIPKMSNPIIEHKISAAETSIQLLNTIPEVSNDSELTAWPQQSILQFFSVIKCRLQEKSSELYGPYAQLVIRMLQKGLIGKGRGGIRTIMPTILSRIPEGIPQISLIFEEFLKVNPSNLFQIIVLQLCHENLCEYLIEFIMKHNNIFTKNADPKTYCPVLLNCISTRKNISAQCKEKCEMILDQIVELNGEAMLEKTAREHKIEGVEDYLAKWNIKVEIKPLKHLSNRSLPSKNERAEIEEENPWQVSTAYTNTIKLQTQLMSLGEPFSSLAVPYPLNENHIQLLNEFQTKLLKEYSDLFLKWIFWRIQTSNVYIGQKLLKFTIRIIESTELYQFEVFILLESLLACLANLKKEMLDNVCTVNNALIMNRPEFKEKSFTFWINQLEESALAVNQILALIVTCYQEMMQQAMPTLARIPAVVNNPQFNDYLRSNYDHDLLKAWGFKLPSKQQGAPLRKQYLSSMGSPENIIEVKPYQSKLYYEMFQKESSQSIIGRIKDCTQKVSQKSLMETHLKIMYTVIVPFLNEELSNLATVFEYFKYLGKIFEGERVQASLKNKNEGKISIAKYLMDLTRILMLFLIDLDDHVNRNNFSALKETVNKSILNLLNIAESKHMLEVLMILLKSFMKKTLNQKILYLIPKCISKVIKNSSADSANLPDYISFVLNQLSDILNKYPVQSENEASIKSSIQKMLGDIIQVYSNTQTRMQDMLATPRLPTLLRTIFLNTLTKAEGKTEEVKMTDNTNTPHRRQQSALKSLQMMRIDENGTSALQQKTIE